MKKIVICIAVVVCIMFSGCTTLDEKQESGQSTSQNNDIVREEVSQLTQSDAFQVSDANEDTSANSSAESSIAVYKTKTGKRYHLGDCIHLKSKIQTSVSQAQSSGLTPCRTCNPPTED